MNSQPNLLIIQTDQQSTWSISAYGGQSIHTPNIDRIGKEGAIFNNYFTNSALCTPSRGCLITGRYPHCHGAYANNIPLGRNEITLAQVLSENGYKTGYIGKWHLDGTKKPGWVEPEHSMGFQDCRYMFNRGHWKSIIDQENSHPIVSEDIGNEKTYTTDWLTEKTIEFIHSSQSNPFFLMMSIPDPHTPFTVREPYSSMFARSKMTVPSTFYQEDLPDWIESPHTNANEKCRKEAEEQLREWKAQYLGEVQCIDDNVGYIIQCLTDLNALDNTIIVFTTDHGEYMGEHGLYYKNNLYETAYKIPLLIRWPEKISTGTQVDQFTSTVDFQQTMLGLMEIQPCGREQGYDASPLLCGSRVDHENEVFIHHSTLERAGIFTPEYELAYVKDKDAILFDRINDPLQINNLFNNSDYKNIIQELTKKIVEHHQSTVSPEAKWLEKLLG